MLHSTLVPKEETALCVFAAESAAAVHDAYARAGVRFERVVDALQIGAGHSMRRPPKAYATAVAEAKEEK